MEAAKLKPLPPSPGVASIPDVLVIGAGIIGLSLAWELGRRGRKVTVVDSRQLGQGTSWAGAGILPPTARCSVVDPYEQLRSLSSDMHQRWATELQELTGIDTGYRRCGGIYLGTTPAEKATLLGNELWWTEHDIPFERLDSTTLAKREPSLPLLSESAAAWWLPDEHQLRNPWHLKALIAACQSVDVCLVEETAVADFLIEDASVRAVQLANGEECSASQFCITSGAWSQKLLERRHVPTGLMPVRGQMLLYACPPDLLSSVINEGNRYLVPRGDGHLLAGSVEEEVGFDCSTTEAAITQIRTWAESTVPQLKDATLLKSWAGLRPGSYDGLPYLGRIPDLENAFLAAGHFRSGLHLSTGTAMLMSNLICNQEPQIDMHPFRVARG